MAKGRMLNRVVTSSKKVSLLTDPYAKLLYTWLIPFHDDYGNFHADPDLVKSNIFPREKSMTEKRIEGLLADLVSVGLIIVYENGESRYLNVVDYEENQTFRSDRPRHADYPQYADGMTLVYQRDTNGIPLTKQVKLIEVKLKEGKETPPELLECSKLVENIKGWDFTEEQDIPFFSRLLTEHSTQLVIKVIEDLRVHQEKPKKKYSNLQSTLRNWCAKEQEWSGDKIGGMTCSKCGRWNEGFCAARNVETEPDAHCAKWLPIMKGAR